MLAGEALVAGADDLDLNHTVTVGLHTAGSVAQGSRRPVHRGVLANLAVAEVDGEVRGRRSTTVAGEGAGFGGVQEDFVGAGREASAVASPGLALNA